MLVAMNTHNMRGAFAGRCLVMLAASMAIALTACSLSAPTRASLSKEEAAKLQLPGSVELISDGGHDAEQTPEGPLAALAWREYGVDVSWDEVVAYFDAELRDRGWEEGGGSSGGRSTQEWHAVAWNNGDRILVLAHRRNMMATDPPQSFITIYRVNLIGQGVPSG